MKILFWGQNLKGTRYWSVNMLREELANQAEVHFYGRGYDKSLPTLKEAIEDMGSIPDVIMTERREGVLQGIEETDIFKVHLITDYSTWNEQPYNDYFRKYKYDIVFGKYGKDIILGERQRQNMFLLPWSVNTNLCRNKNLEKEYDVMASYALKENLKGFYPNRKIILNYLRQNQTVKLFDKIVHNPETYINAINKSKVFVNSTDHTGATSKKVTEAMSCGTFLMTDHTLDIDKLGYKDGVHLSIFEGPCSFERKLKYWLQNDKEREGIAKQGMAFVRRKHSTKVRVKYLLSTIEKEIERKKIGKPKVTIKKEVKINKKPPAKKKPNKMSICVAGWYFFPKLLETLKKVQKKYPVHIVSHSEDPKHIKIMESTKLLYTIILNEGLEWGVYDYYLKYIWDNKSDVLFMHDDVEIKDIKVFDKIRNLDFDQCYIFKSMEENKNNGGKHGRGIFMSKKFLKFAKTYKCSCGRCTYRFKRGEISHVKTPTKGFFFDRYNKGHIFGKRPEGCRDYNIGIEHFHNYVGRIRDKTYGNPEMRVVGRAQFPEFDSARRGSFKNYCTV